jgi:hypothetical protein
MLDILGLNLFTYTPCWLSDLLLGSHDLETLRKLLRTTLGIAFGNVEGVEKG